MKKQIIGLLTVITILLLCLSGCRQGGQTEVTSSAADETTTAADTTISYFENIMSHNGDYPHLTKEEFLSVVKGKTELTLLDFPAEKSCVLTMGARCECFIIEENFLLIIGDESMFEGQEGLTATGGYYCSLGYYENGRMMDSIVTVGRFADFIDVYTN